MKINVTKTPKEIIKIILIIAVSLALAAVLIWGALVLMSFGGVRKNIEFIKTIDSVKYEEQLKPVIDKDGYYTFTTDDNFKIVQLTDIHLGGGFMSTKRDKMALNAVAAMVTEEKPDLVVVTGDIAYPSPNQSGAFNNKPGAKMFAELMEQLGVYWAPVFGNHDTESYSFYSREKIAEFYEGEEYPHCLMQAGPENIDGEGNYVINIKNLKGEITQSLFLIDSGSYVTQGGWSYDCIHENQVEWYGKTVDELTKENGGNVPKSLAFYHIPNIEFKTAWDEYVNNGYKDTENVKYHYGDVRESGGAICSGDRNHGFFDKVLEKGSTQGVFVGHDHVNTFSLDYKGVRLSYSYSIDYLAYNGLDKFGIQRGCTVINVKPDGSFDNHLENYYQDKYVSPAEKETVEMVKNYNSEFDK